MESSTPFRSSSEVYQWIEGFINLERDIDSRPMKLEKMKKLAALSGNPEECAPAIHVAGSKGKGSVCAIAASILKAAGYSVSRYASPHVHDFRERITLNNEFFSEEVYTEAGNELRRIAGKVDDSLKPLTFFELFTLWFFLCSRLSRCDVMVVETGLGGRLDATNIVTPLVSVITVIEKEHVKILGDSLDKIAFEKAGIIKNGRPLVLAEQDPLALEVFRQKVKETGSVLYYFPETAKIENLKFDRNGSSFDLNVNTDHVNLVLKDLNIAIPGNIQVQNAALAVLTVKTAFPSIGDSSTRSGLCTFKLPARFEKLSDNPVIIIDGAHTALSASECIGVFNKLYGKQGILLFGCAADKDASSIAALAVPGFSRIIITTPCNFKKSSPEDVFECFKKRVEKVNAKTEILLISDTMLAYNAAFEQAVKCSTPILVTGSFYLAAEVAGFYS